MPWFERPSAINARISRSRGVSSSSGSTCRRAERQRFRDDGAVDDALAGRDALHRVEQLIDPADPLLHQVSGAFGLLLDESQRVFELQMLREHEDRGLGVARADLAGCTEP